MNDIALFVAVFLACVVEAVEATTIVLAAGATRDWRSAVMGVLAGIVVLAVAVGIAGPAISLLPLDVLRLVVGGLLLVFGLQWMRKAILRASGYKPLHDEELIYKKQVAAARNATTTPRFGISDWYAFTLSFKGVVLEGLEVVFIVLTFGTNQHNLPLASVAAGVAVVLVVILGIAVRGPLSRVPENTLKFVVGIMLTSFGAFWGAEGAGALWPGADLSLLVLVPSIAVFALLIVLVMRARRAASLRKSAPGRAAAGSAGAAGAAAGSAGAAGAAAGSAAAGSVAASPSVLVTSGGSNPASAAASSAPAAHADHTLASTAAPASPTATATATQADAGSVALRRLRAFGLFWYDFVIGDDWQIAAGVTLALLVTFYVGTLGAASWIVMPIAVLILLPYGIRRALRN